ncbi:MAG: energy transducer TonB [Hyphomicrobium sp.]|nr:MAG: energy transducer TonB [Hyphomicrobium sp.]PPC99423.1 MAG: energy transducer TonB [Hyphomicrobium sp.]
MSSLRSLAIVLSLLVHGSLAYAILPAREAPNPDALDFGDGDDLISVEQGIAIEGLAKLGDALETIETAEVTPIDPTPPPPLEEVKPIDELQDAITSEESQVEEQIVKTEEPPPEKPVEETPPELQVTEQQPEQVAIVTEQSSGEAKTGGDAKAYGLYLGQINDRVQRAKVNPRARIAGTVVMKFTVGLRGELISSEIASSSGSPVLDNAATVALERAAPFPPIPPEVSTTPLAFTQPFRFITR